MCDESLETYDSLIKSMTKALDDANAAIKVLNLKVKEQELTIMRLNNGIVKAAKIADAHANITKSHWSDK